MPSQQGLKELEAGLIKDVAEARQQSTKTSSAIGVRDRGTVEPKAIRFKQRSFGRAQLEMSKKAIDTTVKELIHRSGMTNLRERGQFNAKLRSNLNKARMDILKKSVQLKREMTRRKLSIEQQQNVLRVFGGTVSTITEAAVANIGSGGSDLGQIAPPTQAVADLPTEAFAFEPTRALADLPTPFEEPQRVASIGSFKGFRGR